MKICVIPDIHQTTLWKKVNIDLFDKVIFLGDYFDCWTNKWPKQINNFNAILKLKKNNINKVDVLFGNHETSNYFNEQCSGFQSYYAENIKRALIHEYQYMQIISLYDGWLFSHAGVSQRWMDYSGIKSVEEINQLFKEKPNCFTWVGPDGYGNNEREGCLWIRIPALMKTAVKGYNQVVGHTELSKLELRTSPYSETKIICIDSDDHSNIIILDTETGEFTMYKKEI
jgi:predicted MPP superfamily phosphohydrolase